MLIIIVLLLGDIKTRLMLPLVLALLALDGWGDITTYNTYIFRANYSSSNEALDAENNFYGATFQLKSKTLMSDSLSFIFDARLGNEDVSRSGYDNSQLSELYFRHRGAAFDVLFGRRIYSWGKTDGINPVDIVYPKNFLTLLPDSSDQRKGSDSLSVRYFFEKGGAAELAMITNFEASDVLLPDSFGVIFEYDEHIDVSMSRPMWAAKLSGSLNALDWSLYGFKGYSTTPEAYGQKDGELPTLNLRFPSLKMIGLDLANAFGRNAFRAEMAFTDYDKTESAIDGFGQYFKLVAGGEIKYGEYLTINLQYILNKKLDDSYNLQEDVPVAKTFNNLAQFSPKKTTHGASFRISDSWSNGFLRAEFFSIFFPEGDAFFYQIKCEYALNDTIDINIGYRGYEGDEGSVYGVYSDNARSFVEVRYSF